MSSHREWRVVRFDADGRFDGSYGDFHDESTARRVQAAFADEGAVLQHQQPPTIHPWVTVGSEPAPAASDGLTLFRAMGLDPRLGAEPVALDGLRHTREAANADLRAARPDGWTDTWVEQATWSRVPAADSTGDQA